MVEGIERYIEVKGRSAEKGSIVLKGNELNAADRYAARYYVYRLYEKDGGSLELAVLRDPLGDEEARDLQYEVDVFRSEETERFDLTIIAPQGETNNKFIYEQSL